MILAWRLVAAALLLTPGVLVAQPAAAPLPLASAMVDTVDRACVPILSRELALPTGPDAIAKEEAMFRSLGLAQGVPPEAMSNLGPAGQSMLSQAILANRQATDGAFVMALGGAVPTCRLIVYRATDGAALPAGVQAALVSPASGWKLAPRAGTGSPAVTKVSFVRRTKAGQPFLLNLLSPTGPAQGVAAIVSVAAIPSNVALPEGL